MHGPKLHRALAHKGHLCVKMVIVFYLRAGQNDTSWIASILLLLWVLFWVVHALECYQAMSLVNHTINSDFKF